MLELTPVREIASGTIMRSRDKALQLRRTCSSLPLARCSGIRTTPGRRLSAAQDISAHLPCVQKAMLAWLRTCSKNLGTRLCAVSLPSGEVRWPAAGCAVLSSAADARRQIQRCPEIGLDHTRAMVDSSAGPETCAGDRAPLRVLRETVTLLPESYRQVIELGFGRELSTAETTESLSISRSNAATRSHHALHLLKDRFAARIGHL